MRWSAGEASVIEPRHLRPGDVIIVPSSYGGLADRNWSPMATEAVQDLAERVTVRQQRRAVVRLLRNGMSTPGGRALVASHLELAAPRPADLDTEPAAGRRAAVQSHIRALLAASDPADWTIGRASG